MYKRDDEPTRGCNTCKVPKSSCSCVNNPPIPVKNCIKCNVAANSCACKNDSVNLVGQTQTQMPDPTRATREWYYSLNNQ